MASEILLVGYFHEAAELAQACGFRIIGCIDHMPGDRLPLCPYPILGNDESLPQIIGAIQGALVTITPDSPVLRHRLHCLYDSFGFSFASLISPHSRISPTAEIEEGAFIQWNVHVSSDVHLGRFVRVNVAANIMHDVTVGNFSTIAPNACLLGGASVGANCYIGANSTILPGISVGEGSIVGAGAVVTRDVSPMTVVAGNPARILRPNSPDASQA